MRSSGGLGQAMLLSYSAAKASVVGDLIEEALRTHEHTGAG